MVHIRSNELFVGVGSILTHDTEDCESRPLHREGVLVCVCVRTCLLHDMCSARLSFYSIIGSVAEHLACNQKHAAGSSPAEGCSRQQSGPTCGQSAGSRGDRGAGQWQTHTMCVYACVCVYCTQVCLNMGSIEGNHRLSRTIRATQGAIGVVVSHPLSMREALGSIPRLSRGSTPQGKTKKQGRRDGPARLRREQHWQQRGAVLCLPYATYYRMQLVSLSFCPRG